MSSSKKNRAFWNSWSVAYQAAHGPVLSQKALAWGVWRIPESELRILGPIEGRRMLELGCGAAQWTLGLAAGGAHAVGIDLSEQQLAHARTSTESIGEGPGLVQGDAENLPFQDGVFDIVFCDHGATVFAAPKKTVSEAARVLRPGGLFAFCMSTPIRDICFDPSTGAVSTKLATDYFGLSRFEDVESVEYQLQYGAWIRLFRAEGLVAEDLVEIQAPPDAVTTYSDFVAANWARRWPAEHVWKLTKTA
ncbi:MAG: class I SAM-dependent methyltransferase [Verrucomicrobia bacterium]|nr:class I SAM-dependent methyltransferase [Verrucomicrobiota bacterium]